MPQPGFHMCVKLIRGLWNEKLMFQFQREWEIESDRERESSLRQPPNPLTLSPYFSLSICHKTFSVPTAAGNLENYAGVC